MRRPPRNALRYRAKGKGSGIAMSMDLMIRNVLHNPERVSVRVDAVKDSNQDVLFHTITLRAHPEGYHVNFKVPGAPTGEIHVDYDRMAITPRDVRKGGALEWRIGRTRSGAPAVIARAHAWEDAQSSQDTLFGNMGVLLLPGARAVPDDDPVVDDPIF